MQTRNIVFYGDCQALGLGRAYREFVAPITGEIVGTALVNQDTSALSVADVVVSQVFDVDRQAKLMREGAREVKFPAVFLGCLWPFAGSGGHIHNRPMPGLKIGPFPPQMGDSFLDKLIMDGVRADDALTHYLNLDIARVARLDRLLELHLEAQASRDSKTGFAFAAEIAAGFRDTQLFVTASHPTMPLWLMLLRGVFERIGVPHEIIERAVQTQRSTPWPGYALPIHPGVIRHYGLTFVDENSLYASGGRAPQSFREFVFRYMSHGVGEAAGTAYGQTYTALVEALYRTLLSRNSDEQGMQDYVAALQNGMSFAALLRTFVRSKEFSLKHPGFHQDQDV